MCRDGLPPRNGGCSQGRCNRFGCSCNRPCRTPRIGKRSAEEEDDKTTQIENVSELE